MLFQFTALLLCSLSMPKTAKSQTTIPETPSQQSEMAQTLFRFQEDFGSITRFYTIRFSPTRARRLKAFYEQYQKEIQGIDFDKLGHDGQVDWVLFDNYLKKQARDLDISAKQFTEAEPLIPIAKHIIGLEESRRKMETLNPERAAETLNSLKKTLEKSRADLEKAQEKKPAKKTVANRAAGFVTALRGVLGDWYKYWNGYDPQFDWWCDEPYKALDKSLSDYFNFLKEKLVGIKPDDTTTIIGDPIGRDALLLELQAEMIPYTPEELVKIAEKEFAWCDAEMLKASREMGFGDDWKKALEKVKSEHVGPGEQPKLVRDLALEAIKFVEDRDLVTVPELAKETWRMEMMTPERQLQNPFFLGGEQITVSYPTDTMGHEQKLMSLRANNIHFSRATVQHELIPGHHLQQFMTSRYNIQRQIFWTPFWTEGWALYWEMLLWDLGFPKSPENRVGMLFWRMHRCARILFSLNFHLEKWTPEQCVKFLVDSVGHEQDSAAGEVRRSFMGGYSPLYQAAYMLGGLQFRSLHHDLVDSGKMSNREFHDTILKSGNMPVTMVRAVLLNQKMSRNFKPEWQFYGELR